uniref:Uncharacterized protein n=1 Tax=Meloidogyne enterolobii TaxID=390850 RepID=A0A6V7XPF8_MELEN|nr:unnamed protein product [Meloidogyne enterolobii]
MGNHKRLRDESISSVSETDKTPILTQTQLEQITQNVVQLLTPIIETTIKTLFEQLHQKYNNNQLPSQTQQSTSRWGCPPNLMPPKIKQAAMTIEQLQQPVFDENLKELYKKKSFYAVIERFPELENEEEDLKNIERNVQIKNNYHRIIKVKFSTPAAAHSFINQYRTIHKPTLGGHSPFARRDLTPPELQLQNYLKQQVKEINAKHGNGTACYRFNEAIAKDVMEFILHEYGVDLNEEMENITSLFVSKKFMESDKFWNTLNGYIETMCKEIHSHDKNILKTCRFGMFLAANLFLINKTSQLEDLKDKYKHRYCNIWNAYIQNKINKNTSTANIYKNFELNLLEKLVESWIN